MPRKRKLYKNPKELATLLGVLLLVIVIPLAVWLAKTETKLNPKAQTSLSINNMASFTVRKTPQIEKPEYIAVPSGAVTQGLSFTLEAWIKHNGQAWDLTGKFDNRQYIANYSYIHSGYNNSVQFVLEPNKNLSIHLWIKEGMADIYHEYVEGKSFLKTGEWYHIAAVRDQNTRKLSLYVNGIKDGEANGRQYFTSFLKEAYYIGSKQSSSNFFQGLIDEFRDSSIARYTTPTFSVPKNPFTADSYTNVLYHLDETGWATTAIDSSGNGRNGTVLNVEFIPSTAPLVYPTPSPIPSPSLIPSPVPSVQPSPSPKPSLIPSPSPVPSSLPDLTITKIFYDSTYKMIYYEFKNIGAVSAPSSYTALYIDGVLKQTSLTPTRNPGSKSTQRFTYNWSCTNPSDEVKICADSKNTIQENSETNNCLTQALTCP